MESHIRQLIEAKDEQINNLTNLIEQQTRKSQQLENLMEKQRSELLGL